MDFVFRWWFRYKFNSKSTIESTIESTIAISIQVRSLFDLSWSIDSIGNLIYGHDGKFEAENFEHLFQELIKDLNLNEGQFYKNKPKMAWFLKFKFLSTLKLNFNGGSIL